MRCDVARPDAPPRARSRVDRRRLAHVPAEPVARARARARSPTIALARSGCAPVSWSSDDGWRKQDGAATARYGTRAHAGARAHRGRRRRRRRRRRRPLRRADRRARGRARRARLARRRSRGPPATGPRAASPRRSPIDDSPDLHREDTERRRPRPRAPRAPPRSCAARRRGRVARPRARSACASTPTATATSRSASRAATRAAASSTPAAARPAGASCASCPRSSPRTARSTCSRARAPPRCGPPTGAASASCCEDGRAVRARGVVLATGGAAALWSRTTNPPGSLGHRPAARPRGGRRARRPRVHAVPPDRGHRHHRAARASSSPRRSAARAPRCTTRDGERFVDELAPRDEVARAIWRPDDRDGRARRSTSTCATSTRPLFPNVVGALREAGLDPTRELVPVAPAAHYVMGGIVTDLDGAHDAARASTPSASRACTGLHGANRLASNSLSECFVFGAARALAPRSTSRAAAAPASRRRRAALPAPSRARRARRCGATPGSSATREGLAAPARRPAPARPR